MIAYGRIVAVNGNEVHCSLPGARLGARVRAGTAAAMRFGTIRSVREHIARVVCVTGADGLAPGDPVCEHLAARSDGFGTALLGRCIDARLDVTLPDVPPQNDRYALTKPLWTGVRCIDGLLTIARGARIGLFGPPAAGKSSLLQAVTTHTHADAIVIGLVGERGREAQAWSAAIPSNATLVCATSDRSAGERIAAAHTAMTQAVTLRARGLHVLLILDSLARYAAALREIALADGEPAGRAGYPASVFAHLARLLEVAGACAGGSITLVATVLSDGDERDPVSDAARSLLDGHVQLSATLAARSHYPAIDVLQSSSRTMNLVASRDHLDAAAVLRRALFALARTEDARSLGLATDESTSRAAAAEPDINVFLTQDERAGSPEQTLSHLRALADTLR